MYSAQQRLPLLIGLMVFAGASVADQVCSSSIPLTHPNGRLVDQRNGTVTDTATGLMWKQCAEGLSGALCATGTTERLTWQQALQRGTDSTFAGYSDWRLPNKNELESLVERSCSNPAIRLTAFPNTPAAWFWSSSPYANDSNGAWYVNFTNGIVSSIYKDYANYVRLVRGGQ